jgi:hypothetical protein
MMKDWADGLNGQQYTFLMNSLRARLEGAMINRTGMSIHISDSILRDTIDVFMLMLDAYKSSPKTEESHAQGH